MSPEICIGFIGQGIGEWAIEDGVRASKINVILGFKGKQVIYE